MFDNFDNIGKILIVKSISFKDCYKNRIEADHSSLTGRPCVILDEIDDKIYLLPFTSKIYSGAKKEHQFCLYESGVIDDESPKKQYIKLTPIIEKDLFFGQTHGELKPYTYYYLLKKLISLYNCSKQQKYLDLETYKKIESSINEKVLKLEKIIK